MSDPFGPIGDLFGIGPASRAADAQTHASDNQTATANSALASQEKINADTLAQQKDLYNQDIARNKPFYDTGVSANANLDKMVNGGYDMNQSPAAQYELTQGTKSLNRQLAARGLLGSGNASQRLAELSSGVAANDYNQQYSRLLDQVKIGTGASASAGASSSTLGSQIGQGAASLSGAVGQNSTAVQNAQYQAGQGRAALYGGQSGATMGMANLGLNAYRSGLFSGSGAPGTTYDAGGANFAGNTPGSGTVDNYGDPVGL